MTVPCPPPLSAQSPTAPRRRLGRIGVLDVGPLVEGGNRPAKSVVEEEFDITATVFREGHDAVNATVVLTDPTGRERWQQMTRVNVGLDAWAATVSAGRTGRWSYREEGWSDPYGTWNHDAVIKVGARVDVELMLEEGARVLERAVAEVERTPEQAAPLREAVAGLRDAGLEPQARLAAGLTSAVRRELEQRPLRDFVSASPDYPWLVERERALFGSWYEFFPRSEGAVLDETTGLWTSGSFTTAARRLPAIAEMGFDVVYLTPVHPIGRVNRKGRNNSLHADQHDPGSPYAIGSTEGGHDAIHPDLGTFDDLDDFVAEARRQGLEVALDLALNCAPDHPWVSKHPEWFTTRADGSIAYAENPPKKYQDIYPPNFDNDPEGLYREIRRIVQIWLDHGIRIFRVDNPHTKTVDFWEWLIADVAADYPEVIWLAEAFTRPAMMHGLAKVGFQQSYTYYAWRHTRTEIEEYAAELAGLAAPYMRPSFWPTTHDILTPFLQHGGPTAWKLRAALAATLSPTYGIYAGYELVEHVARPGAEEQIDNEKYQYKNRRWEDYEPCGPREGQSLAPNLTTINAIRRAHPALQWLRNLRFHRADDENVLVFSKRRRLYDRDDVIMVVANLDPHNTRDNWIHLNMPDLGLEWQDGFVAHDLITREYWNWAEHNFVRLGPRHGTRTHHRRPAVLSPLGTTSSDPKRVRNVSDHVAAALGKAEAAGAHPADLAALRHRLEQLTDQQAGLLSGDDLEPLDDLPRLEDLPDPTPDQARDVLDRLTVIKLNGGLGTSMGLTGPKSLLDVKPGASFLDIVATQVLALRAQYDARLPLLLMNSAATRGPSVEVLHQYAGLREQQVPLDFLQGREPKLRDDNLHPVEWPADPQLEWCPPGHGDIYTALAASGTIDRLLDAGLRWCFVSNADNLGALPDVRIAAWVAAEGVPFAMEAVRGTPADRKGGHLARYRGRVVLRETAQVPDGDTSFTDIERWRYYNTNNLWVDLAALKQLQTVDPGAPALPLIVNRKTVDPKDPTSTAVIQLETAMGAAIGAIPGARPVQVPRARFAPVKTTDDLLVVRSDAYELSADGRVAPTFDGPGPVVTLDKEYFRLMPEFERRFPEGVPSLRHCRRLKVTGDVTFGADVVLEGDVHVTGPCRVPDEQVLRG